MKEIICIGDAIVNKEDLDVYCRTFLLGGNLYALNRLGLLNEFWSEHGIGAQRIAYVRKHPEVCGGTQEGYLYAKENYDVVSDTILNATFRTLEFQNSLQAEAEKRFVEKISQKKK